MDSHGGGLDTWDQVRETECQDRWLTRDFLGLETNSPWNRDEDYDNVVKSEKLVMI